MAEPCEHSLAPHKLQLKERSAAAPLLLLLVFSQLLQGAGRGFHSHRGSDAERLKTGKGKLR